MKPTVLFFATLFAAWMLACPLLAQDFVSQGLGYRITSLARRTVEVASCLSGQTAVTVPETVESDQKSFRVTGIGPQAFSDCVALQHILMPEGILYIADRAFERCTSLRRISLPESLSTIGESAFSDCIGLNSVLTGSGLTRVDTHAFSGCNNLRKLFLKSVPAPEIAADALPAGLAVAYVPRENYMSAALLPMQRVGHTEHLFVSGGVVYLPVSDGGQTCHAVDYDWNALPATLHIPDEIEEAGAVWYPTAVGLYAFSNASDLEVLSLGNRIDSIDENAFIGCSSLHQVDLGTCLSGIGRWAFSGCNLLEKVVIPDGVSRIGARAFYYCSGLRSVKMGRNLESIGGSAFYACTALHDVVLNEGLKAIEGWAFHACESLNSLVLPVSLQCIATRAFNGCSGLEAVEIPDGVDSLGQYAFANCTGLTTAVVGDAVKRLNSAFSGCNALASISLGAGLLGLTAADFPVADALQTLKTYNPLPPVCEAGTFAAVDKSRCRLYVPKGTSAAYGRAVEWNQFSDMEEMVPEAVLSVESSAPKISVVGGLLRIDAVPAGTKVAVYTGNGMLLSAFSAQTAVVEYALPAPGIYMVQIADQAVKVYY